MTNRLLALDVGSKRIGVATADTMVRIAVPYDTIEVDGNEVEAIATIVAQQDVDIIVVGYPRNQSGEATAQTAVSEDLAARLNGIVGRIVFQDESLTSVMAENRLKNRGKYTKGDVDKEAAAIILQDYMEQNYAA